MSRAGDIYYICRYADQKPLLGPMNLWDAVDWINLWESSERMNYCTMSRYQFVKSGKYPRNKDGDEQLAADVEAAEPEMRKLI